MLNILIFLILFTGCFFEKSEEHNKTDYFTITEKTPLINQKFEKPGLLYYADNHFIYHENDIIIRAGVEMGRVTKGGELKWKIRLTPNRDSNRLEKYNDKIWVIGTKIIGYSLETGEVEYEEELPENTSIAYTLGFKDDSIFYIKKPFGEEKIILQEWSISQRKEVRNSEFFETNDYFETPVAVEDNIVYFAHNGYDGRLYDAQKQGYMKNAEIIAVSLDTFEKVWSYELPSGYNTYETDTIITEFVFENVKKSNYIFYKDMIVVPVSSGLIALNKKTGEKIWSNIAPYDTDYKNGVSNIISTLVFDEEKERIFAIGQNYDFNLNNKIEDWNTEENIFCIDINTGKKIWARGTGFSMMSSPTLYKNNLYISSGSKMLIANADNGDIKAGLWYENPNEAARSIGFIDGEGLIFLGSTIAGFDPIK